MPSLHDALHGESSHQYIEAMKLEVSQLLKQNTWTRIPREDVPAGKKVLKGTWALKLKRLPDGTPSKYKARFCVRGNLQTEVVDYFKLYVSVVQ